MERYEDRLQSGTSRNNPFEQRANTVNQTTESLRESKPSHSCTSNIEIYKIGDFRLKWLPDQTLVCGTILGNVIAFDGRSGTRKYELQGHGAEVYDMCYDRAKGLLLCASEDSTAKIFQINH